MDPHDPVRSEAPLLADGAFGEMKESLCLSALVLDVGIPKEGFVEGQAQVLEGVGIGEGGVVDGEVGVVKIFPGLPTGVFKKAFGFLRIALPT